MVDRFVEKVAEFAGKTARTLEEIASVFDEIGLEEHGKKLREIAKQHSQLALDCLTETQPIEVQRYRIPERIQANVRILRELSADLLTRGKPGHNEIEEAADLLQSALEKNRNE